MKRSPKTSKDRADVRDIFVRAHTTVEEKQSRPRPPVTKWPAEVLVFDTETTTDTVQSLNLGVYRRCKLTVSGYQCIEEGLFYADDLAQEEVEQLRKYVTDPRNFPGTEVKKFPPQTRLSLLTRSQFVKAVFWKAIRRAAMIVGFNLPFDLSRLAVKASPADGGGWSLVLSMRPSRETGELEPNPDRPRIVIKSVDSKMAFISLRCILHPNEWPQGRFLDLHTLGRALRDESFSLERACQEYRVEGKLEHTPTGKVTWEEIDYCRQDVRATAHLLNAMRDEFKQHPINLQPDKAYSPASIAKAYLEVMGIALPKVKFDIPDQELGIPMQAYYGGRAECRIRKTPVPVVHTDFTSQYPTDNTLFGNWDVLTAESVSFEDCTDAVRKMVAKIQLDDAFDPKFWKRLSFFALVLPANDIFPVRTVYNGRTQNIGLNYLSSDQPIWFAGPDIVASCLLARKPPQIIRAIRLVPHGRQKGLVKTNLGGMVEISPESDDFFRHVIEQKTLNKATNKAISHFLKILANSGSYGLFVEANQERVKPTEVKVFSGEIKREQRYPVIEKRGRWYFPPLASVITSGGRLLLAMLERSVTDLGGSYLFCDTDSLCIVSNQRGGLIACVGGPHKLRDGREAVKVLSWLQVERIAARFNALNPYNRKLVPEILKIEDVNFTDSDPSKRRRQLFGYANSAKRYILYEQTGGEISIVKASGHGLGYLYPPKKGFNTEAEALEWVAEAWGWLLSKELGLKSSEPAWLDYPAMMRLVVTSPNIICKHRPEWFWPFNFCLLPLLSDLDGYPAGCNGSNFRLIMPFTSNSNDWTKREGVNLFDGKPYRIETAPKGKQDRAVPESFRTILRSYLRRPESKSLAPDGKPCTAETTGLLRRAFVVAADIIPVGKETDRRWEQGEDMSLVDFQVLEYRATGTMLPANETLRNELAKRGVRSLMRATGLSQHTIERALRGDPLQPRTLKVLLATARITSDGK